MLPLDTPTIPADAAALARAIRESLTQVFALPAGHEPVRLATDGAGYPAFKSALLDLSGAEAELDDLPPRPEPHGRAKAGPHADLFELLGHPIRVGGAALDLEVTAHDAQFAFKPDRDKRIILLLKRARQGRAVVEISRADLQTLVLNAARLAASAHGVKILDVDLALEHVEEQGHIIRAQVDVTAQKFIKANVRITGQVEIDDDLDAHVSSFSCTGHGMVGALVCGFIQPHLDRLEGRTFPLLALPLTELRLHDVDIDLDQKRLRIQADFGS